MVIEMKLILREMQLNNKVIWIHMMILKKMNKIRRVIVIKYKNKNTKYNKIQKKKRYSHMK
jgi:hypothetical protein